MSANPIAVKRILRDTAAVCVTNAAILAESGIYYSVDDSDVTNGTAMLVGPVGTPYFGGFYFFSVKFPNDYPFSPITVKSLTQDGYTRFNPNMYVNGKVCLSVLNTWHDGPQWSGVQTLESVLLVIMSDVLHENPIINEPAYRGYAKTHPDSIVYNRMVWHSNLHTAVLSMMKKPPPFAEAFKEEMEAAFLKNREALADLTASSAEYDGKTETSRVYSMNMKYDFSKAFDQLKA